MTIDGSVSVIIPVYNAEPFVEAAVLSALAEPEVLEVILVDDGGPDNSLAVCERLAREHPKVFLYRHPDHGNHGAARSRNLGFSKSVGTYVAFLDADDAFLPGRFKAERRIFLEHPDADGVYGAMGVRFHSAAAQAHFTGSGIPELTTVRESVPPEQLFRRLLEKGKGFGYFHLDCLTAKRSALDQLPYVFPADVVLHEDTEYILRMAFHARLYAGSITGPVAVRGVHEANRITRNSREYFTRFTLYRSLASWSRTVTLDLDLQRRIETEFMRYTVLEAQGTLSLLALAGRFVRRPWSLNDFELRRTYFDRLFGEGTAISVFFQKLVWRLLNGLAVVPPNRSAA